MVRFIGVLVLAVSTTVAMAATDAPVWRDELDRLVGLPDATPLVLEQGRFPVSTVEALQQRGHTVQLGELTSGAQALVRGRGAWLGGADPRREGVVMGD